LTQQRRVKFYQTYPWSPTHTSPGDAAADIAATDVAKSHAYAFHLSFLSLVSSVQHEVLDVEAGRFNHARFCQLLLALYLPFNNHLFPSLPC
jgi:hypothetical protein